jgi:hypothetical protein
MPTSAAPARSSPHPQRPPGRCGTYSSGLPTHASQLPGAPFCFPAPAQTPSPAWAPAWSCREAHHLTVASRSSRCSGSPSAPAARPAPPAGHSPRSTPRSPGPAPRSPHPAPRTTHTPAPLAVNHSPSHDHHDPARDQHDTPTHQHITPNQTTSPANPQPATQPTRECLPRRHTAGVTQHAGNHGMVSIAHFS